MFHGSSRKRQFSSLIRQLSFVGKKVMKLDLPQDDTNLILGGNVVRLFGLEDKVTFKRLFKEYL